MILRVDENGAAYRLRAGDEAVRTVSSPVALHSGLERPHCRFASSTLCRGIPQDWMKPIFSSEAGFEAGLPLGGAGQGHNVADVV